jgi:hypothetical protein
MSIQLSLFDVDEFLQKSVHPYHLARISENYLNFCYYRLRHDISLVVVFIHRHFDLMSRNHEILMRYLRDEDLGIVKSYRGETYLINSAI